MINQDDIMPYMKKVFSRLRGEQPYEEDYQDWDKETEQLWDIFKAGADCVCDVVNTGIPSSNPEICDALYHNWVSAKNEVIINGSFCTKCHMIDSREPDEIKEEQKLFRKEYNGDYTCEDIDHEWILPTKEDLEDINGEIIINSICSICNWSSDKTPDELKEEQEVLRNASNTTVIPIKKI